MTPWQTFGLILYWSLNIAGTALLGVGLAMIVRDALARRRA